MFWKNLHTLFYTLDPSVALHSTNLTDVTASISQDKTEWSYDQILAGSKVAGNGSIDASGITAGAWNGTFNFNVEYESTGSESPVTLEAGLYDANGVMLCSWDESGIDVETDYSISSSDENYYQTSTTSGYYVLRKNYPTATKVVIPDNVTSIGDFAFRDCINLTDISISDSVTSIGDRAFQACINLTEITIPDSVTSMEVNAVYNCTSLTSINVDENNSNYCSVDGVLLSKDKTTIIKYPTGKTSSYTIPEGVTSIGDRAFGTCTNLTSITIPYSVTSIGFGAFYECTNLTNVTVPNSVTSIGDYAFNGCKNLTSITISDSVTSIGIGVFRFCTSLTNVTIPESITSIGNTAFSGCTGLIKVTIPDSVISIEYGAFYDCTNLTDVIIPDSVTSIGTDAFKNVPHITYNGTATGSPWGALAIN